MFFVFFLHLFTGRAQRAVYQIVRGEGFEENAFTCSVADFAVGEAGRVARKYGGSVGKSGTFPWPVGENREREGEGDDVGEMFTPCVLINSELG